MISTGRRTSPLGERIAVALQRALPLLLFWVACVAFGAEQSTEGNAHPTPPAQGPAVEAARALLAGDSSQKQRLIALGPQSVASVAPLFHTAEQQKLYTGVVDQLVEDRLRRSMKDEPGLIYSGQFADLLPLDGAAGAALLVDFCDEDLPQELRTRAAMALGDLHYDEALPRLREVVDDFLSESWFAEEAGYLMARLGDRSYVSKVISSLGPIANQKPTPGSLLDILEAHTKLAEVYYRMGSYIDAVEHYRKKRVILVDLSQRVRSEFRGGIEEEIALLDYNLACSLSLAGKTEEAFSALDNALASSTVTLEMVLADGDLRAVRAQQGFASWLAAWKEKKKSSGAKPTPAAGTTGGGAAGKGERGP